MRPACPAGPTLACSRGATRRAALTTPTAPQRRVPAPTAKDLPPADAIPGTFTVRQKLTAHSAQGGGSFEAVLQKKPGELTPRRAHAVRLAGLPAAPDRRHVAVHLVRAARSAVPAHVHPARHPPRARRLARGAAAGDGERAGGRAASTSASAGAAAAWSERTFTQARGARAEPPGDVTITYAGDGPAGLAAPVTLVNARLGYSLAIETVPLR